MEIDYTPDVEWTTEDTLIFRQFLRTQTGSKLLGKLAQSTPPLLPSGHVNAVLIRSGEVRGVTEAVKSLYFLAFPVQPIKQESRTEYADPTDDKAWDDGQKLIPELPTP